MSVVDVDPRARIEDLVLWSEELVRAQDTEAWAPLRVLLRDIAELYVRVVAGRAEPLPSRDRIRAAARVAGAAGVAEGLLREAIRSLTEEAIRRAPDPAALLDMSYLVLADCLAGMGSPQLTRVERLLNGERPERAVRMPADRYTMVVFRVRRQGRIAVIGLLAGLDGELVDGREVLAGCYGDNAVILVPGAAGAAHARRLIEDIGVLLGGPLSAGMADCEPGTVVAGYGEAAKLLALAMAAGREPGIYAIDDFLMEYAAMRNPVVSERLLAIVRPLLSHAHLYQTLRAFIRYGHDRGRTAAELAIHRTTVDYRIRRITEITGHDPGSAKGGQLLAAAVTLAELSGLS